MALRLTSSAFSDGARIPLRHSCEGEDLSPPLSWSGPPPDCRSFAILCEDPDAPGGTWRHWAIFDIPAAATGLAEGIAVAERVGPYRQGMNDFRRTGYGGPCPPRGHGPHRYNFRLLALDVDRLELPAKPGFEAIVATARRHALAEAVLTGTYAR